MSTIRIVSINRPKKGKYINTGTHLLTVPDGMPTFHFCWQGILFSSSITTFVFARDAVRIEPSPDNVAKSLTRMAGFTAASTKASGFGILGTLVGGAVGAAATRTNDIKGFLVFYHNEEGQQGAFYAVASPEIVDEIFRSVPADKHGKGTPSSNETPTS